MKKSLFLTLLLALLCTVTTWAQFAPEEGKLYALREITKGYYLDIQTKGMKDNNNVTNNISLNTTPCIIYFEAGANGTWKMKNANGEYVCVGSSHWNPTVGGATAHEWKVDGEIDKLTFQRQNDDATGYIGADDIITGVSLYNNQTKEAKIFKFSLIDLGDTHDYYNMKAVNGGNITNATGTTYFSFKNATVGGVTTQASYSTTPANLYIPQTVGRIAIFEDKDNHYYINYTENIYNITKSNTPALYVIGEPDANNYVLISKKDDSTQNIGHDGGNSANINTEGTGIFTNVGTGCHKWELVKHNVYESTVPTFTLNDDDKSVIKSYGQYLTKLTLKGITIFSDLAQPTVAADMYVLGGNSGVVLEPGSEYTLSLTFPKNQTSQILAANLWFDKDGDGTYETHLGTTGQQGSNNNNLTTVTFTVPSDASNCFTSIRLRLDSSWGIAATPDADANRMVYDFPVTITIPPVYTFNVVNPSGENVSVTYNGNPINNGGEITGGVKEDLFTATDVKGYAWSVVVNSSAKTVTLVYEKKYTWSIVNLPDGATITYNNNAVADGGFGGTDYDSQYLAVTCPGGYTWEIARDDENKIVTITFTQLQGAVNPQAVVDLINRIGGAGTSEKFQFVLDPSLNYAKEVFVISGDGSKVLIKGTTISAITTGIGWYLQNIARINIAWNSLNEKTVSGAAYADLSNIPLNVPEETHTSDAMYRYYLNTCVFGYSMTTWTWKRWQQEIDWMALHGINMPLQLVGLEEVWRKFLTMEDSNGNRKYGYTDTEAKAFVAGPAFIAWWAMNNLQGWGGTDPGTKSGRTWEGAGGVQDDAWYARQKKLAKQICDRQRELGMQPVIPGWSGMVPTNFASKSTYATRNNGGNWAGDFVRPLLLSVSNANYGEIAADYYKCLHEVMGESQYYSMDPFHEGGGAGTMEDYEALYAAMEAAKPGSKWVIQQWQWSPTQKYSLTAVPAGRLIVLDLFSDGSPAFDSYSGYAPQDAVFCAIPNFGGRSGLMGRLTNLTDNYFKFKAKYASIKGIGAAPEAIEQTPVTYDLIFQLPWMNGVKPDVAEWVSNYSIARYGVANAEIQEAWSLLRQGPLNYGADGIQGPVEDVWAAKPNLTANKASAWGKTMKDAIGTYTKARHQMLIDATYKLLGQKDAITGDVYLSNYYYDLVEFGGGVLADYAYYLLLGIGEARDASNTELYEARRDAFLQLILDVDAFKGTNLNFRLGKWTQEARDAAGEVEGATTATPDWYEYNNARTIVSTWSTPATNLNDYSYRSWQGLMKDLYYPRWKYYFDNNCTDGNYDFFAWNWAHGKEHYVGQTAVSNVALDEEDAGHTDSYTREPEGNTVEKAKEVLGKYIIPVVSNTGTYYAYRCLTNDLTSVCTVIADAGQTIDLSSYFGELTGVSITGDFIDGTATDITQVAIIADATDGSHTGTITLTDGTVLTFAVVIDPAYNGVYKLALKTYNNGSVQTLATPAEMFVQYNTTVESGSTDGYKLIAKETFSASDEADKYFIITPLGAGYSLSAQGLYLKQPDVATWNHINFSDSKNDAGAYLFTETGTGTGIFKISSTASGKNHMNAYNDKVMGNDASDKYSTFTITEVTTYPVTIPASGLAINLPFNVVLPEGVTAYDVVAVGDNENSEKVYETTRLAVAGGVVKAGTPVILKATAGDYTLPVTVNNSGAVGSKPGSVLRGNFIKQSLTVSNSVSRYTFADAAFTRITVETELAGNSVWMELAEEIDGSIVEGTIKELVQTVEIEDGAIYRIKSQLSNGTLRTLYTNGAKKNIRWTQEEKTDAATLFIAKKEGEQFRFISALADGLWSETRTLGEVGALLTLSQGSADATYMIVGDGNRRFATPGTGTEGDVNYYSGCTGTADLYVSEENSTDFIFEKVDANVTFTVSFKAGQKWATMFLPFAVAASGDATAYYSTITGVDNEEKKISLTSIENVIPANTAVLVGRDDASAAANVAYAYTAQAGEVYDGNIFQGYVQQTAVPVDSNNKKCYLLLNNGKKEAFFWVYAEYNANCQLVTPNSDVPGYVKCDANKAYMLLDKAGNAASSYSFVFDWNGTTDIEEIVSEGEGGESDAIYDLHGRKIIEPVRGSIYIKNGKVFIAK